MDDNDPISKQLICKLLYFGSLLPISFGGWVLFDKYFSKHPPSFPGEFISFAIASILVGIALHIVGRHYYSE
jgi:hypothetical protein